MTILDIITPTPVERVNTANGSMIDPPYSQYGNERERLAWKLGVVHTDTGIRLELHDYGGYMNLSGPGFTCGLGPDVWGALTAFSLGVEMARKVDAA